MNTAKRMLCVLLAALMLSGCCAVLADTGKDYSGYRKYVSLGDSIANGIGENNVGHYYMNYTPGAYPDRISKETGADLTQLACGGMRSVELRACLEDDYIMPDELANNFNRAKVQEIRSLYAPAIADADLITLNIGLNDIATYALLKAKTASSEFGLRIDESIAALEAKGEQTAALVKLLDLVKTVDKYGNIVKSAVEGLYVGYTHFIENWDSIIGDIYALNPDVTLMVAGFYNPFDHLKISDNSLLEVGKAADGIMELLNLYIKHGSDYSDKYIFVDIMGVQSMAAKYGDSLTDEGFFQSVELNVHPSNEGQAEIGKRFIALLPEKSGAPFTDIASKPLNFRDAVDWAYAKGITSGKTADKFCPDEFCTRAQIISMLWRAAGSPSAKCACPFSDVKTGSYFYDAVCWGYEQGIVNGFTEKLFCPEKICTRAQVLSFIYRYAGSPSVNNDINFNDVSPDSYCYNAVRWAVENKIANGFDSTHFRPDCFCTRVQAVTFLFRHMA